MSALQAIPEVSHLSCQEFDGSEYGGDLLAVVSVDRPSEVVEVLARLLQQDCDLVESIVSGSRRGGLGVQGDLGRRVLMHARTLSGVTL